MKQVYPFGSELKKVEQQDKSPKKVFVLGVYASAVHAKWLDANGGIKVNALAVASEPEIFWKGDNADQIINEIKIPLALGKLIPADERFNGPSGKVLDDLFLLPLGYTREDAWLCDILPYSRVNPNQQEAIGNQYNKIMKDYNLPECTIPPFKPSDLNSKSRVNEIVAELEQSQAKTIILLGDLPIKYFLSYFSHYKKLSDLVNNDMEYGEKHSLNINGKDYDVIPLVHPRQAGNLGNSSKDWFDIHKNWVLRNMSENFRGTEIQIRLFQKPSYCPVCGSSKVASYLYGMPDFSKKLESDMKEGKVKLGGCCITNDDPFCTCLDCKKDFHSAQ